MAIKQQALTAHFPRRAEERKHHPVPPCVWSRPQFSVSRDTLLHPSNWSVHVENTDLLFIFTDLCPLVYPLLAPPAKHPTFLLL